MVKLNLKRRKQENEEILEDVDLTAIVEQKRKRSQGSRVEEDKEIEREGEKTSPSKTEVEGNEKRGLEPNVAATTTFSIDSYLQERFLTWLIEQAMSNDSEFNMLMEAIDRMDIDRLRMLCKIALRKLREKAS